uniref:Uncharacterized protein n=1 Tax=Glossina brevipalpis TaxID=37001 RepID=A0A1A9WIR9_9MUSC
MIEITFMEPDDLKYNAKLQRRRRSFNRQHRTTLDDIELEEEYLEVEDGIENDELTAHQRDKRQAPYIIYPEILVIVDYDGYRLHGGDNLQVKRYFISFWNGVDLRYRLLKGPRIRISIAGIIISRVRSPRYCTLQLKEVADVVTRSVSNYLIMHLWSFHTNLVSLDL